MGFQEDDREENNPFLLLIFYLSQCGILLYTSLGSSLLLKLQSLILTESVLMNTNACGQLFTWQLYNIMDSLSTKELYFPQAAIRTH